MCIILFSCVNKKADAPDEQYKYAHLPNTITGVLDSIPFYVDTSKVTQDELKGSIAYEDRDYIFRYTISFMLLVTTQVYHTKMEFQCLWGIYASFLEW